jgi:hypothetical protein
MQGYCKQRGNPHATNLNVAIGTIKTAAASRHVRNGRKTGHKIKPLVPALCARSRCELSSFAGRGMASLSNRGERL